MQHYNLYSDGNYFPRAKKSGFGGYIVDSKGDIVTEYSEQIKDNDYQHSFELLGIIRGLKIAMQHGIKNITSHCDDKNTASKLHEVFVLNEFNISKSLKPELYEEIIDLAKNFENISFKYIPRSQNKYADSLSRRYAEIMEMNFIRQYQDEVFRSESRLSRNQNLNKKTYFIHKCLIHTHHKNNPFLVANVRNKKVRRLMKDEISLNYDFLFTEIFTKEDTTFLKSYHYNPKKELINSETTSIDDCSNKEKAFCDFLVKNLTELKLKGVKKIWCNSNHQTINKILEQREKFTKKQWNLYRVLYKSLDGFDRVFFNNLPFEHTLSKECEESNIDKNKITEQIMTVEELIDGISCSEFSKERGKYFGALIRHELQNYREKLERELESEDIKKVIQSTVLKLEELGCKNLPKGKIR